MMDNVTIPSVLNVTIPSADPQGASQMVLPEPTYIYITVTVIYVIVFLFGVLGNVLVIYVVCALKEMRTPTNIFLVNLSAADLLVLIVCMPSSLVEFHARDIWLLGSAMCEYQ